MINGKIETKLVQVGCEDYGLTGTWTGDIAFKVLPNGVGPAEKTFAHIPVSVPAPYLVSPGDQALYDELGGYHDPSPVAMLNFLVSVNGQYQDGLQAQGSTEAFIPHPANHDWQTYCVVVPLTPPSPTGGPNPNLWFNFSVRNTC